jgi:tetratricopeptide (TPR) repeat protein
MASSPTPTPAPAAKETSDRALREAHALHQRGDHARAAQRLQTLLQTLPPSQPQHLGQHAEVVALAERALALRPELPLALDLLAKALHRLGRDAEAAAAGTRSLLAKDRSCLSAPAGWALPASTPHSHASQAGKRAVIALSLWGAQPRYLRGALRNALLLPDLLTGWTLRIYLDATVPAEFVAALHGLQVETVAVPAGQSLRQRLAWRFAVANDPSVGRFLVHDRCFAMPGSTPLPPAEGHFHIGQDEFTAHPRRQQALLQAWVHQLPCLATTP